MNVWSGGLVAVLAATLAPAAVAQEASSVGAAQPEQMRARFQIAAMEGVLERAVQLGARRLSQQVQAVSPDMLFIAGAARARGFWLDGYGVFFDVDVPALRRSIAWSFRVLDQGHRSVQLDMQSLRQGLASVQDVTLRQQMEEALRRLERSVVRPVAAGGAGRSALAPAAVAPEPGEQVQAVLDDPGLAYTSEVKAALISAMIDYGAPIPIDPDEWLTVAARDNDESRLGGGDPYDVATIVLRVRGRDLDAYRAGELTRDEIEERVETREY